MKKNILFFLTTILLLPAFVFSQVGMNSPNPSKAFHIDGGGYNTSLTDDEVKNDFIVKDDGSVGVGTIYPSDFSALEILSDKGFRLPQLSTDERDALVFSTNDIPQGLMLYNTTTNCVNIGQETKWLQICCSPITGELTITPAIGSTLKSSVEQTFTVSGVSGTTSYVWTINDETQSATSSTIVYTIPSGITALTVTVVAKGCGPDKKLTATYTIESDCTPPSGKIADIEIDPVVDDIIYANTEYTLIVKSDADDPLINVTKYKWTINDEVMTENGEATYTYTTTNASTTFTVKVEALGECDASEAITFEKTFTVCKPVSGDLYIELIPSSVSLSVGDVIIFSVSDTSTVENKIGNYLWTITNGTEVTTGEGESITYTVPDNSQTSLTVQVVAKGCGGSYVSSDTLVYTICHRVSGNLSISTEPTYSSSFAADSLVKFTVNPTNVKNMVGEYQWTIKNSAGTTVASGSGTSISYTMPTNTSYITVEVIANGCNGSQITSKIQTYNITSINTKDGSFINLTPNQGTNSTLTPETLWLKGASGAKFVWTMYLENGSTIVSPDTGSTARFTNYSNTTTVQYTKIVVKVYNSAGVQTHERTYTNLRCPAQGAYGYPTWIKVKDASNCSGYRICAYNSNGSLDNRYVRRCPNEETKKTIYIGTDYSGQCTARQALDTCPNDL